VFEQAADAAVADVAVAVLVFDLAVEEGLRSYLKNVSKSTWDFVAALTHDDDATRHHAEIALSGSETVLAAFSDALVRFERGAPDRCPACESYRVLADFRPEIGDSGGYVTLCANCGWEDEEEV